MCFLNVKHQCQKRLATLPSKGYLIYFLVHSRQRGLICLLLSQFKVDNSANLILFKQFNLISSFRLYLLFRSFLFNQQSLFKSLSKLGSLLRKSSAIHCLYKNRIIFKLNNKKQNKTAHFGFNKLKKQQYDCKFKIKRTTKNHYYLKNYSGQLPEIAKLIRRLNSIYLKKNLKNLKRPTTINDHLLVKKRLILANKI